MAAKAPIRDEGSKATSLPAEINTATLAKLLGISRDRIEDMVRAGEMPKIGRGRHPYAESVQAYVSWVRASEQRKNASSTADQLRTRKDQQLAMRIAKEERELISMEEAMAFTEEMTGLFLDAFSGLPARITRDPKEQHRIEDILDGIRQRLSARFAEVAQAGRTGRSADEAGHEDNA